KCGVRHLQYGRLPAARWAGAPFTPAIARCRADGKAVESIMTSSPNSVRPFKVEIAGPQPGYDGFFKLEKYRVRHERFDGGMSEEQTLEVFERGDAVAVLLVDPDEEEVFLVEQFRLPTRLRGGSGWILEPPAGLVRPAAS